MNLPLDARQRAMLHEMGITVWSRPPEHAAVPQPVTPAHVAQPQMAPASPPVPVAAVATAGAAANANAGTSTAPLWLAPPVLVYSQADPALAPPQLGAGWLVVVECATPEAPFSGDAGRLLDAMLRAMQLHRHPQVHLAALQRGTAPQGGTVAADLASTVRALQPSMVLLMGLHAARAALGRTDPLGRLRAEPHTVAGAPATVTYEPAFLLRSQDSKAAAWADLCQALARVRVAHGG